MVKKKTKAVGVVFLIASIILASCLTWMEPVFAQENVEQNKFAISGKIIATEGAMIYKGFSESSVVIDSLAYQDDITILEEKFTSDTSLEDMTRWYKVKTDSTTGYVRADMASIEDKEKYTEGTTTANVNMREGAGLDYRKIKTLDEGTTVKIVGKAISNTDNTWYSVYFDGEYYFISSLYVEVKDEVTPQKEPKSMTQQSTAEVKLPKVTGTINSSDGVNVRGSHTTSSSIVGSLDHNSRVTVLEEVFTNSNSTSADTIWYKIETSSVKGYIRGDLIKPEIGSYATGETTASVNMREGAGTDYVKVATLLKGASIKVVMKSISTTREVWYKIYYKGEYRYLSSEYVTVKDNDFLPMDTASGGFSDTEFERMLTSEGFPETYKTALRALHEKYPTWKFKAKKLGFSWDDALAKQYSNVNANLVASSFLNGYKAVKQGTYNFDTHTYIGKDGSGWVAASKAAVAFYMDPRNWLTADSVFMFETQFFDSAIHTEDAVKRILANTALPTSAAKYYMDAAAKYNVSPVFLAVKTRIELGNSDFMVDGHSFAYGGKKYSNCYNVFNIGASDSADGSAALKGLVYANGGTNGTETSFGRPWNTLEKAISGGAQFIIDGYLDSDQYSPYYERFNVLGGLSSIGTHQYATSVFYAATQGQLIYQNYQSLGILENNLTFEIPVYENMSSKVATKPGKESNNCYLDSIKVSAGGKNLAYGPTFNRFTSSYTINESVPSSVEKLTFSTVKNVSSAKVTILNNNLVYGQNKVTVKSTSASGIVKYYYFYVTREKPNYYVPQNPSDLQAENIGGSQVGLSWKGDTQATGYRVKYKRTDDSSWYYFDTENTSYTKTMKYEGALYEFKVRAYYEEKGERVYSANYSAISKEATFGASLAPTGYLKGGYMTTKVSWSKITGAGGYSLLYKERNSDDEWTTYNTAGRTLTRKMESAGKGYDFKVVPYKTYDGVRYFGSESPVKTVYTLRKTTVKLEKAYTRSIKVSWENISGESGYMVYRSTSPTSGFSKVQTVNYKTFYWNNPGLTLGKIYYYKVKPYKYTTEGGYVYGPYSEVVKLKR